MVEVQLFLIYCNYLYQSSYYSNLIKVCLGKVRMIEVALRYLIYVASFVK